MNKKSNGNNRQTMLYIFILVVIVLVVALIISSMNNDSQESKSPTRSQESVPSNATLKEESNEDKIKKSINDVFVLKQTDTGLDKVSKINIVKNDKTNYEVEVNINSDSYQGLLILENESADIYISLYSNELNVSKATVHGYHQFSDEYGNSTNEKVLTTQLDKDVANKINFGADEFDLRIKIIPGLWTKSFTNHKNGY